MSGAGEPLPLSVMLELFEQITEDWALDADETLRLLGRSADGRLHHDPAEVADAARRLALLTEFAPLAAETLGGAPAVRRWLRKPNRVLGGARPIDCMARDPAWVRQVVDGLRWLP